MSTSSSLLLVSSSLTRCAWLVLACLSSGGCQTGAEPFDVELDIDAQVGIAEREAHDELEFRTGPRVAVSLEPSRDGALLGLRVAPETFHGTEGLRIGLYLLLSNHEDVGVDLESITVRFPGRADPTVFDRIAFPIAAGQTRVWAVSNAQNIFLEGPAPERVIVDVKFSHDESPVRIESPVRAQSRSFPFFGTPEDLERGEVWATGTHWSGGQQNFAYDIAVGRQNPLTGRWDVHGPGSGPVGEVRREDYYVWGKPVYAMADGRVFGCIRDQPDTLLGEPGTGAGANAIAIVQDDEMLRYIHMQQWSIPEHLCTGDPEIRVSKGDFLGLIGNSGTVVPHIHLDYFDLSMPVFMSVPLAFENVLMVAGPDRAPGGLDGDQLEEGHWGPVTAHGPGAGHGHFIWPAPQLEYDVAPAIASREWGQLDVFVRGSDHRIYHREFSAGRWHAWHSLGDFEATSGPAAVSWGPGRVDLFVRGTNNALWHREFDHGAWGDWQDLGGTLASGPSVASWAPGRLDVFWQGADNQLWLTPHDHGWWSPFPLGGRLTAKPAAISTQPGTIDVVARTLDGALSHRRFDGTWHDWVDIGGYSEASASLASWRASDIMVFGRDGHERMYNFLLAKFWAKLVARVLALDRAGHAFGSGGGVVGVRAGRCRRATAQRANRAQALAGPMVRLDRPRP